MSYDPIVQDGDPVLRKKAREVPVEAITTPEIASILEKMQTLLKEEHYGVALAAPQIGESLRMFIVSGRIFGTEVPQPDLVFINPEITKLSKETEELEEGCLSVRHKQGNIVRAKEADIAAYNQHGEEITMQATGLLAQIFQHEVDHLNGILFIDKAHDLYDVSEFE